MSPPSNSPSLALHLLPDLFFVIKTSTLSPDLLLSLSDAAASKFFSITRTRDEISIVGVVSENAEGLQGLPQGIEGVEGKWRCIKVAGPMEHDLVGVLSALTAPLAVAKVPVFALSTWDTDYVLVDVGKAEEAMKVLSEDGWIVSASVPHSNGT